MNELVIACLAGMAIAAIGLKLLGDWVALNELVIACLAGMAVGAIGLKLLRSYDK